MSNPLKVCIHILWLHLCQNSRENFPLPLPQVITLGQVFDLLKGAEVLGCWSLSVSWSEVVSITTGLALAWLSLPSSESLQSDF